jgi:hypothetical protein
LLATKTTAGTAFGAKFLNDTAANLGEVSVQVTGEVWRQSNVPKTLQCYYVIDPTGTNAFPTNATAYLPALNVNFPTNAADTGGVAVNGTLAVNQTNLNVANLPIANWPPGAALWLIWQMPDATGSAQGLGIDNLSFTANVAPPVLNLQVSGNNLLLDWPTALGQSYQLEYKNNLTDPTWLPLGNPVPGTGNPVTTTNTLNTNSNCFFRLVITN